MNKEQKLRFVIIGAGYIGKRHAATISRHASCVLVAFIEKDTAVHGSLKGFEVPVFASLEQWKTEGGEADAVVIGTPNGTHAEIALQALSMGLHVLIEKPMALSKKDADQVLAKAEAAGKCAMVVLQNRFSHVSQWLKEIMDSKRLGRIFFVEVNCFWNRDERYYQRGSWHGTKDLDGGSLFTQFSHFIDMIYWLFGDVKNISSRFYNYSHQHLTAFEDTGMIRFELENEGSGCFNFSTSCWEKNLESSITILAEKGSIKVSGQYMNAIEHCRIKDYELPADLAPTDSDTHNDLMLDAMVNAIRNGSPTNAHDAAKTVEMIERMYEGKSVSL